MDIRSIPQSITDKVDQWTGPAAKGPADEKPQARQSRELRQREALKERLREHMVTTYRILRRGMGWLAICFPFVLLILGWAMGVSWQPSISDYYYALPDHVVKLLAQCAVKEPPARPEFCTDVYNAAAGATFPLRALFCGGLVAIGAFLILYQGITRSENNALNIAGAAAIGVALFPMSKAPFEPIWPILSKLHFPSAVVLFACMWFICQFRAKDTLIFMDDLALRNRYRMIYRRLGYGMLMVLLLGGIYFFLGNAIKTVIPNAVWIIEALGIVVFGAYWLIKSKEIAQHKFGKGQA